MRVRLLPTGHLPTAHLPTGRNPTAHLPTSHLPTAHLPTLYQMIWAKYFVAFQSLHKVNKMFYTPTRR